MLCSRSHLFVWLRWAPSSLLREGSSCPARRLCPLRAFSWGEAAQGHRSEARKHSLGPASHRDRAFVWKQIALGEQNQHFLRQNKEHQAQLPHPGSFSSRLTFLFGFSCPGMAQGSAAEGFGFSTPTPWSHSLTTEQQSRFFALLQEASPEFPRMLQDGEHGRREFCHSHFPKREGGEHPQR